MKSRAAYQAYVIRLWPAFRHGKAGSRVLLEEVATHDRIEFADLDGLFDYLRLQSDQMVVRRSLVEETQVGAYDDTPLRGERSPQ